MTMNLEVIDQGWVWQHGMTWVRWDFRLTAGAPSPSLLINTCVFGVLPPLRYSPRLQQAPGSFVAGKTPVGKTQRVGSSTL